MENKLNFNKWVCRASAFHKLMTEPKTKAAKDAGELSETTKTFLLECFREAKYNRRNEFESKYTDKGLLKEGDSITLVSRLKKKNYKKNETRLTKYWVTGIPDIYDGKQINRCKEGGDVKSVWSLWTLPSTRDVLDKSYEWQNKVYMYLTNAKVWFTYYCLVNAPDYMITDEKKRVWYKMGQPEQDEEHYHAYLKKAIEIEKNMIFDMKQFKKDHPNFDIDCKDWKYDVPMHNRVVSFKVDRTPEDAVKIKVQVIKARKYLNELAEEDYQLYLKNKAA